MNKTDAFEMPADLTSELAAAALVVTEVIADVKPDLTTPTPVDQKSIQQDAQPNEEGSLVRAGHLFRDARLAKNLSVQDVSNSLRLSIKQIEALENDEYSALPEAMIVRGFMRNYARLLKVDAEPILDAYKTSSPEKINSAFTVQSAIKMADTVNNKQSWNKYKVASMLMLLGLLLWLLYVNVIVKTHRFGFALPTSAVLGSVTVATTLPEALPEIALPIAERKAMEEAKQALEPVPSVALPNVTPPSVAPVTQVQSPLNASASLPKVEAASIGAAVNTTSLSLTKNVPSVSLTTNANSAGLTKLPVSTFNFSVKESTWLSLTDASGQVVFSKTLSAGSQESLQVQVPLPIKVVIGNVNGTKITYNEKAVDLANYATLNVAKFSLK